MTPTEHAAEAKHLAAQAMEYLRAVRKLTRKGGTHPSLLAEMHAVVTLANVHAALATRTQEQP